ncbi:MAG: SnoaL-like domain-containing protein [Chloroflexi bacterium]|jgi:ketosteroid isomerase-like protein|nr:MAG: SnoaL-like domain-containing protein [Chloroflexota bacterium]
MTDTDLAARVRELHDIEAVKQLKALYCFAIDDRDIETLMPRFTADAVWEGGPAGRYEGRAAIAEYLENLPEVLSFALHWVVNPLITVAGDEARARWYLIEPCTGARSGRALWGAGHYDDRLVREGGVWKFREVVLKQIFWTPFDEGWAKKRGVA